MDKMRKSFLIEGRSESFCGLSNKWPNETALAELGEPQKPQLHQLTILHLAPHRLVSVIHVQEYFFHLPTQSNFSIPTQEQTSGMCFYCGGGASHWKLKIVNKILLYQNGFFSRKWRTRPDQDIAI